MTTGIEEEEERDRSKRTANKTINEESREKRSWDRETAEMMIRDVEANETKATLIRIRINLN